MVNQLIEMYQQGSSLAACGRQFNKSPQTIKKILQQNGIKIRSRHEQCILENMRRGYSVNHDYFDVLDDTKAYYLGFIAADGTVRKERNAIKIGIQAKDKQWLEEFKQHLNIEAPIREYLIANKYQAIELSFSSAKIKQTLAQYDIVPNKTYMGVSLKNIPKQYILAFIKGFYDGDGCYTAGKVKITSKTDGILKEIQNVTNYPWHLYYFQNRDLYSLELSIVPSRQFLTDIYNLKTPCLMRKYNHFQEYNKSTSQEPC